MVAKFALLLLLAFVSAQAYSVNTYVQYVEVHYEDPARLDIWDSIKKAISFIINGAKSLVLKIKEIFDELQAKVTQIISQDVKQYAEQLMNKLKQLVGDTSEKAKKCTEAQRPEVEKLAEWGLSQSINCAAKAQETIIDFGEKADKLKEKGDELKHQAINGGLACLKLILHPSKLPKCFRDVASAVTNKFGEIKAEGTALATEALTVAKQTALDMAKCEKTVLEGAYTQLIPIAGKIKECIVAY